MKRRIQRDGPGELEFGDTLMLKSIREDKDYQAIVSLSVFGSHVEVDFPHHKDGVKPNIDYSERNLSDKQEEYVKAMAFLSAGMMLGWFEHKV